MAENQSLHMYASPQSQDSQQIEGSRNMYNSRSAPEENSATSLQVPQITLPKGGGAIKSIDEKFLVNAVNGTATFALPLPVAGARGFSPAIGLGYSSGAGNGIFGLGWSLSVPSIKRKTEKELPQYLDAIDSDTYIISEAEDLVPEYKKDTSGHFIVDTNGDYVLNDSDITFSGTNYGIRRYRPRMEGLFSRIERWTEKATGSIHWRVISKNNITALYGKSATARIADPADDKRIFEWLLEFTYDDKGNCALYEYKPEDSAGIAASQLHNRNRINGNASFTNTYLKRIRYGNKHPYTQHGEAFPASDQFLFETVFDYGEHDPVHLPYNEINTWNFRQDAFSEYRSGFEIRTCRLCSRVLLYHHFNELPGGSALTKSLQVAYDNNGEDGFTFLMEATVTGYTKHDDGSYTQKSFPPFSFQYQKLEWNTDVQAIAPDDQTNLPSGIDASKYQLVDLYSEGLSGILTEQGSGWLYKTNLGEGHFAPAKLVAPKPSFSGLQNGLQLMELEANGIKQIVHWQTEPKGFFELDEEGEWQPFKPFSSIPNINFRDANTRLVDLNGDGLADVLITEDDVFTWYPSKGKKGYEESQHVAKTLDQEKGPAIVFAGETQSIFLADMSGDGLLDLVRIANGNVCYWPNLGYGKFGAKVAMDGAPVFDSDDQFDTSLIRLADIDGSGTADIVYLGQNQLRIWLNQQGNSFLPAPKIFPFFPEINNLTNITVTDLLGTGLSCIVWSSSLPTDQNRPLKYIDLMNSKKPHILIRYQNNLGKEVQLEYTPSTKFYITDKLAGTPWITKLPFPVHCVAKVTTYDRIMKTRFASEYTYHHGYYDHFEREFRGFGRIDQKDAEDIAHFVLQGSTNAIIEQDLYQPPVLTKTWYHTGAFLDREKILSQFAQEYYQNSSVPEKTLPEPELPDSLTVNEYREACRSCKGILLRKETYALDGTADENKPYTVEQHNCLIKFLQPAGKNKHSIFLTHESEAITYHYERNPADPRIAHSLIFDIDPYGNILQSANVVYPRKTNPLPANEQMKMYITFMENTFTNVIQQNLDYRTPLASSSKTYEVTGIAIPLDYFQLTDLKTVCNSAAVIDYEVTPNGSLQKRIIEWVRTQYRGDDTTTVLPFGTIESKGLNHTSFKAACNDAILNTIFSPKITLPALKTALTDPVRGGYIFADNYYWIYPGTTNYDAAHFYLPTQYADAFGNSTQVQYDSNYFLFVEQVTDALNNVSQVEKFNYRVLSPYLMKDINDNLSAVRFDEAALVVKTFIIGKKGIDKGDAFDDTKTEMKGANDFPGASMEYDVSAWYNQTQTPGFDISNYKPQPSYVRTLTRETHYYAHPLHQTKWQEAYVYSDGGGQVVLKKNQAEPGEALQVNPDGSVTAIPDTAPNVLWVGNGRTILNNKGNAVKQYEPYFSIAPTFDDEKEMVQLGVTPVIQYDPLNRIIRTDYPNKTFSKVEFTPWLQKTYDANDTVMDSEWYINLGSPDPLGAEPSDPAIRAAWLAAKDYNTPALIHLDTLGRSFLTITTDGSTDITTKVVLDIEGNQLQIIDGLNRIVMEYQYGLLSNKMKEIGMDAGQRWGIQDVAGKALFSWDDRGHRFSSEYDVLQRPVSQFVEEGGLTTLFDKTEYGESLPIATAKANNLCGKMYRHYDQSGITTTEQTDFKGNILKSTRQFLKDYKNKIDWTTIAAVNKEAEIYKSSSEYDALNRPVKIIAPHISASPQSEFIPGYNEAGLLETMDVKISGATTATHFITNVNYNAKAQREAIFYGNETKSAYTYEKETFRLIRLLTTRSLGATIVQDLNYTFDPVGNITQLQDNAQPDVFFDGELVKALSKYEYDALYRLIKATGRKHAGQTDIQPKANIINAANHRNYPFVNSPSINPNDANAFRNYTEQYTYDKAGNMQQQQHIAKNSSWTRTFEYDNGTNLNNHLTATTIGADTYHYTYDAHGNMLGLETVLSEAWNFMDHFKEADLGGGGRAYYVYDAGGQRVRKIIERQNGNVQERIYLGSIELYREKDAAGAISLQRDTLHIMDDQKRIAMVDIPVTMPAGNTEVQLIRYQYSNHLSSACLELDDAAQIISYEEYFPYGTTSYFTIDAIREVSAKRYRYTGMERDEETGFAYHTARYYLPWLGRWLSADPIGIGDGFNLYCYAKSNPIRLNDTNGNYSWGDFFDDVGSGIKSAAKGIVEPALVVMDFGQMGAALVTHAITGDPDDLDVDFLSATGNYIKENPKDSFKEIVYHAAIEPNLNIVTGGGYGLGKNIVKAVQTGDPDQARHILVQGAAGQVAATAFGSGVSKATGSGWTGRGPSANPANDKGMFDDLAAARVAAGKVKGSTPRPGDATFSTGEGLRGRTTTSESVPEGVHAEPQTKANLPAVGGKTVAVDQVPCPRCTAELTGSPTGQKSSWLPWNGDILGSLRVIVPENPAKPGGSPKSAMLDNVAGKADLVPREVLRVPFAPPVVPLDLVSGSKPSPSQPVFKDLGYGFSITSGTSTTIINDEDNPYIVPIILKRWGK